MTSTSTGAMEGRPEPDVQVLQIGIGWLPERDSNGLDRVFHALVEHLPEAGVGVSGLVVSANGQLKHAGPHVHAFASETAPLISRLNRVRRSLRAIAKTQHLDLVTSHFALYTLPVLDVLRRWPLVVHFHGPWALESQVEGDPGWVVRMKASVERAVYRRGVRFVVLSEAFREVLARSYGVPEEHIRIVPGGVDVDAFDTGLSRRDARHRLGWPTDRPLVLAVRRLVRRVGLEGLVASMRWVRSACPEALLLIGGRGPLEQELRQRIAEMELDDHVRLVGYLSEDDLPVAYRAADVSIVPSIALEGFGLVAVESLAAGTPVLVSAVGGLREIVAPLSETLVLPSVAPMEMAAYLGAALRGELDLPGTEACQTHARTHHDWSAIARRVRAVYEEVL
jgi:glycosyltransferase involved in cell wall biosynthesis